MAVSKMNFPSLKSSRLRRGKTFKQTNNQPGSEAGHFGEASSQVEEIRTESVEETGALDMTVNKRQSVDAGQDSLSGGSMGVANDIEQLSLCETIANNSPSGCDNAARYTSDRQQ